MSREKDDFIKSYFVSVNKLFGISLDDFSKYYDESKYSGYPEEPSGSVWKSEGKFIYVIIRHLKPKRILEIGNFLGRGSTNHILQAVEDNKIGHVVLLDIEERLEYNKLHSNNFERVIDDSLKYVSKPFTFDLIIQDGNHEYEHVKTELELMGKNTTQDFWLWGHDYFTVRPPQCEIARSWADAKIPNYEQKTPLIDSISNCGFIIAKIVK
jgi:hypothetical protein